MSEEVEIEVKLSSVWHNAPPVVEVLIDDVVFGYGKITEKSDESQSKTFIWKGTLDESEHTLTVRLKGKNIGAKHTLIDDDGNITHDQLIHNERVSLDQIEIGFVAIKNSIYYPAKSEISAPKEISEARTLGWNGDWKLKFTVPTYMWLLENM